MATEQNTRTNTDSMNLKDFFYLCLDKWKWFLLSVVVFVALTLLYLFSTEFVYERTAQVMIKEDDQTSSMLGGQLGGALSGMGLFNTTSNVSNELLALKSPAVVYEVVHRLKLDYNYSKRKGLRDVTLYGKTLPIEVTIDGLTEDDHVEMDITFGTGGQFTISDMKHNKTDYDDEVKGKMNAAVQTPVGNVTVRPTSYYTDQKDSVISVVREEPYIVTEGCIKRFSADISEEDATVIDINFKDVSIERINDFINMLIEVYKEYWMNDKNQLALSTSKFIDERLGVIEHDLGHVDNNISAYKSKHLMPDVVETTKIFMKEATEAEGKLVMLRNELYMATYIRDYLRDNSAKNQLLPSNMLSQSKAVEEQIAQYNALQLRRNSTAQSSSTENPIVAEMDSQLAAMRGAIMASLNNAIGQLQIQIKGLENNKQKNNAQIASTPIQAKDLLSVERQQRVLQELYIFLLQKREENELTQAFTAYNTRIICPPMGSKKPISPKRLRLLALMMLIGLAVPAAVFWMKEKFNTTVRGKQDLTNLATPFIGEIPLRQGKKKDGDKNRILVKPQTRNIINEAFRVIRTNLEFMSNSHANAKVVLLTSINPGSGKTFITMNLSSTFAIKGKHVITIDLDIRKASLSEYVGNPKKGITNYLTGQEDDWKSLIKHNPDCPTLDIIPVGTLPPNPAELLANGRLQSLITELRSVYDMVFLDSAPVDIVADTNIIADQADMTLFVIRSGLLERNMLPVIERFYTEKKLKNMALILNGTKVTTGRHHRQGYGYGYGYGSYTKEEA